VYALGDLDPRRQQYCEWFTRGSSVALLYREFDIPILFASGTPDVLDALPEIDMCLLQIPETFRTAVEARFAVEWLQLMRRMALEPDDFSPPAVSVCVEPLGGRDETDIRALYADGVPTHEEPDFFMRSQLEDGTFFGVRHEGTLVAAGGTHLYSASERVGAIGNVYTHRSHRGRGYASAVTAAVSRELIERGTETLALNVKADNGTAIHVYSQLGFRHHANFYEGRARKGPSRI
jgi:ribosomal protein S18 acetylase RimI-like enzyme